MEEERAETPRKPLSVTAAVNIAKSVLSEHTFHIEGEVSELNQKPGYKAVYFTIKDENSTLPCMIWNNRYKACGAPLRLGACVEVVGKFTIFAPKGRMNFDVSSIKLAGEGDLRAQVAQLALKLRNEGLMDPARKRPLVRFPQKIGLVTSPRGAAVHDVLRTLRRRYPMGEIIFAGVPVEGKQAASGLIAGIETVIQGGAEEVLLVRGGGSFEDLMPFNDEMLARCIAASSVPIITGIGHEPDTSIADMVADLRASTPTAAAEAVSPSREELNAQLDNLGARMTTTFMNRLARSFAFVKSYETRPLFKDPNYLFSNNFQLLDLYREKLNQSLGHFGEAEKASMEKLQLRLNAALPQSLVAAMKDMESASVSLSKAMENRLTKEAHAALIANEKLTALGKTILSPYTNALSMGAARLNDLSPLNTLDRGWSIAKNDQGRVVKSIEQVKPHEPLTIQVSDGIIDCQVENTRNATLYNADQDL